MQGQAPQQVNAGQPVQGQAPQQMDAGQPMQGQAPQQPNVGQPHAGNGSTAAERWPAHAGNGAAASRNEWPAAAASPEQCKSGPGCDPYGARRQKCRAGSGPAESLPAGSIPASSEPDFKPAADVLLFLHNSGTSGANRFRTE